jgi:hypothetical protein
MDQRDRLAMRRQGRAVIDVMHPVQRFVLPGIDFQDDLAGAIQPGLVVADRRRRHHAAIGQDRRDFHQRHVERAEEALPRDGATWLRCMSKYCTVPALICSRTSGSEL